LANDLNDADVQAVCDENHWPLPQEMKSPTFTLTNKKKSYESRW